MLDREIEAFNQIKADLEQHHMWKFVVIKDSDLVGATPPPTRPSDVSGADPTSSAGRGVRDRPLAV